MFWGGRETRMRVQAASATCRLRHLHPTHWSGGVYFLLFDVLNPQPQPYLDNLNPKPQP